MHAVDPILNSVSLCKIPFDEKGVIVDRVNRQILVPVQIAITGPHIECLKSNLSGDIVSIEAGKPTAGTAGQILIGSLSASSVVNVYLMTSSAFQVWQHQVVAGGTCTPSSPVASQTDITSYSINTIVPTPEPTTSSSTIYQNQPSQPRSLRTSPQRHQALSQSSPTQP